MNADPPFVAMLAILAIAAGWDLKSRRIPNALILVGLLAGPVFSMTSLGPVEGAKVSAMGFALAFVLSFPQWALKWLGGGDAKLFLVVGTFLGPGGMADVMLHAMALNGILALAFGVWTKSRDRRGLPAVQVSVPTALPIAIAGLTAHIFPLLGS